MNTKIIKSAFESMMYVWGQPLDCRQAADVFGISKSEALSAFRELQKEYEEENRGIRIKEINEKFQFVTCSDNIEYIEKLCTPVKHKRFSQSSLEVLAIIAYKQPVTKGEIESIRGIRSDRIISGLISKGLVEPVGRSQAIGRPVLYGTTDSFLKLFGFTSLKNLPDISDIDALIGDSEDFPDNKADVQMTLDLPE